MLGLGLGLRPQNSGLGLAFGRLCLGLAGQLLGLALADAAKLHYINSNIQLLSLTMTAHDSVTVHRC